jgi:hypothetical protein
MTKNYENRELKQGEIVETSLLAIETMIETIKDAIAAARAFADDVMDETTLARVADHVNALNAMLTGPLYLNTSLEAERIRLSNFIRAWDGLEPEPTGLVMPVYTPITMP